jgi:hypothetical protein
MVPTSWLVRRGSDDRILRWADAYANACYERVGVAEVGPDGASIVRWDEAARAYEAAGPHVMYVLRRSSDQPCSVPRPR